MSLKRRRFLIRSLSLRMETVCVSETSEAFNQITFPEDGDCVSLKRRRLLIRSLSLRMETVCVSLKRRRFLIRSLSLRMETVCVSETSEAFNQITFPEDGDCVCL
jgi:hypothetical protein